MVPRAKKSEIVRRRNLVGDLYVRGFSQTAIAHELGVAQSTVSLDLKAIEKEWKASTLRDFDTLRAVELRKLDRLEREAWEAWQKSQEPAEVTKVTDHGNGKKAEKTVKQRVGDARFLEQIHKCLAARRALLGLDAPTRIAPTSPDGQEAYGSHVMAELMRLAEQHRDGPEIIDAQFIERHVANAKQELPRPERERAE